MLLPWTAYIARTLPNQFDTGQWRVAWVGFDSALVACFALATWLGVRRRRAAVPLLAVTATMLCCDAWFDVVLDWGSPDRWTSVALAACAEVPIAIVLLLRARSLLAGGLSRRTLTAADIGIRQDPDCVATLAHLDREPAPVDEIAAAAGLSTAAVRSALGKLADVGDVRRDLRGRWRAVPLDLREPDPQDADDAIARHYEAKYDAELRLFSWAVEHRHEFASWAKGHRTRLHLTPSELAALDEEYAELLARYCFLHRNPAPGTREVAIRHYAFPQPGDLPEQQAPARENSPG